MPKDEIYQKEISINYGTMNEEQIKEADDLTKKLSEIINNAMKKATDLTIQ